MTHVVILDGVKVTAECVCAHPELTDNTCPIHCSNCETCRFCKVEIPAEQFFKLQLKRA